MPGSWLHLGGRFFASLGAHDLTESELGTLSDLLSPAEVELFLLQPAVDRRHGLEAARYVETAGADGDVIRAAALHDVAKRHARLGIAGRVVASLLIKLGLPVAGRFRTYRDHGPIAAVELESAGAPAIAVSYARSHHGSRPSDIDRTTWALLDAADGAGQRSQSV